MLKRPLKMKSDHASCLRPSGGFPSNLKLHSWVSAEQGEGLVLHEDEFLFGKVRKCWRWMVGMVAQQREWT